MSDNITREPYRNAWYKQLSDAVKKHDEEIAEMTPHLVPNVEEGDNGKILIAGEEGAFDWGQLPEELPIITEGDEGKVLKVDEGVPKWLEDKDAEIPSHTASDEGKMLSVNNQNGLEWKDVPTEIPEHTTSDEGKMLSVNAQNGVEWKDVPEDWLVVTITRTGSSAPYTYTADKTFAEIKPYADKGKAIAIWNGVIAFIANVTSTRLQFTTPATANDSGTIVHNGTSDVSTNRINFQIIYIDSNNAIDRQVRHSYLNYIINVTNVSSITEVDAEILRYCLQSGIVVTLRYDIGNTITKLYLSHIDTTFHFINIYNGIEALVSTVDRSVTIRNVPTLPAPPSTDGTYTLQCTVSSGTPTYSWV